MTTAEFDQFIKRNRSPAFLASRFAAKEAVSKALATGIASGVGFHSIEVVSADNGKPELMLHDRAAQIAQQQRVQQSLLTLSDEKKYCVAFAVLDAGAS